MAIGSIVSPTTPIPTGTVATSSWASNVEDNINGLIAGTGPTLKAIVIDGTGGASAAPTAGTISASVSATAPKFIATSTVSGASGAVPAYSLGQIYKDLVPAAGGGFTLTNAGGTLVRGWNIDNTTPISRTGTGTYAINLATAIDNSKAFVMVTVQAYSANLFLISGGFNTPTQITVRLVNTSNAAVDPGGTAAIGLLVFNPG